MEITIEKGGEEQWKQILETDSSVSAKAKVTDHVFFDIEEVSADPEVGRSIVHERGPHGGSRSTEMGVLQEGEKIGRVTFGLFGDVAPRTVENFRALATGQEVGSAAAQGVSSHEPLEPSMCCWARTTGICRHHQVWQGALTCCASSAAGRDSRWRGAALQGVQLPSDHTR